MDYVRKYPVIKSNVRNYPVSKIIAELPALFFHWERLRRIQHSHFKTIVNYSFIFHFHLFIATCSGTQLSQRLFPFQCSREAPKPYLILWGLTNQPVCCAIPIRPFLRRFLPLFGYDLTCCEFVCLRYIFHPWRSWRTLLLWCLIYVLSGLFSYRIPTVHDLDSQNYNHAKKPALVNSPYLFDK